MSQTAIKIHPAPRRGRNLGIGRRSPVMQNGQVPGIKRRYSDTYLMILQEITGRSEKAL